MLLNVHDIQANVCTINLRRGLQLPLLVHLPFQVNTQ